MNHKCLTSLSVVFILAVLMSICMPVTCADPSVMIDSYELYPEVLMPGDNGLLTLTIKNAETQATKTKNYVDGADSITIVENNGVVINKIWINPAYDNNGKKIKSTAGVFGYKDFGNIAPGANFQISFELIAEENISEGYYFPNVRIDLEDAQYEDITFPIEVRVSNETVDLISTNVPSKISVGGSTDISLSVVNKRKNNVGGITISSDENNDLDFNPESIFIGTLESGKSEDIIFCICLAHAQLIPE